MFGITPFDRRPNDMFDPFDEFFGRRPVPTFGSFKTDVRDEGDKYVLEAELPGFEKDEIKLDILGDMLTLLAEHTTDSGEGGEQGKESKEGKAPKYIRRERSYCSLKRSFDLSGVDTEKITAEYRNGILCMDLPKKHPDVPQTRRLEIR